MDVKMLNYLLNHNLHFFNEILIHRFCKFSTHLLIKFYFKHKDSKEIFNGYL